MPLTAAPELAVIIALDRDPAQAAGVRRKVRRLVAGWNLGHHADLAELIVSELVANALRHGAGPIGIRHRLRRAAVRPGGDCGVELAELPQRGAVLRAGDQRGRVAARPPHPPPSSLWRGAPRGAAMIVTDTPGRNPVNPSRS